MVAFAGGAAAKSLYVNKDLNANSPIAAYDIDGVTGCLTYQAESSPTRYGGAGLTIDTDSETLFVTFEGSGKLDVVDATNLGILSQVTAPGANNLAGIVVDQEKARVYAVNREASAVYVYNWNSATKTLTLVGSGATALSGLTDAYGLALDEENKLLFVGDRNSGKVRVYSTDDWSLVTDYDISQKPMAVAVDNSGKFLYTGNAYPPYGCTGDLVQTDLLKSQPEKKVNIRPLTGSSADCVVGVAVDPLTGLVYVTTGNQGSSGSDRILVFDQMLALTCPPTGDIGNPTGIAIPGKEISFNPLELSKDDDLSDGGCVYAGDSIVYDICYENKNDYVVEDVTLTDTLPPEVVYSSSIGGTYVSASHSISWDVGDLVSSGGQQCVSVTVDVKSSTIPLTVLVNSVVIEGTFPGSRAIQTTVNKQTTVCANTPPVAICKDIELPVFDASCEACGSIDNGSYDPEDVTVLLDQDPDCDYGLGETSVQLTVTDSGGLTATCSATVTVTNQPPTALCKDALKAVTDNCEWTPVVADAGDFDNDSWDAEGSVALSISPLTPFGLGPHTITLQVMDECGATATCQATVTVIDDEELDAANLECGGPGIISPPEVPVEYNTAYSGTKANGCPVDWEITDYACQFCNGAGKTVDKLAGDSCQVEASDSMFRIDDSGGVGDHISFTVEAEDQSGHTAETTCTVCVTNPGKGGKDVRRHLRNAWRQLKPFECPPEWDMQTDSYTCPDQ